MATLQTAKPGRLNALGEEVKARSIEVLEEIDRIIDSLTMRQRVFETLSSMTCEATTEVHGHSGSEVIDPDGTIERLFFAAQGKTKNVRDALIDSRRAAKSNPDYYEEDGIVEEFARTIETVARLHNNINDLRKAIALHDADRSPASREFDSLKEMVAYMNTR